MPALKLQGGVRTSRSGHISSRWRPRGEKFGRKVKRALVLLTRQDEGLNSTRLGSSPVDY